MMKRYLMLCAFILSTLTLLAHDDKVTGILETDMVSFPGGKCQMYRLYLKDKDLDHTPFSVNRPSEFLSQRSIDRRKRQGIPVDLTDLPVAPAYEKQVTEAGIEIVGKASGTIRCSSASTRTRSFASWMAWNSSPRGRRCSRLPIP